VISSSFKVWKRQRFAWFALVFWASVFIAAPKVCYAENSGPHKPSWLDISLEEYKIEGAKPLIISSMGQITESAPSLLTLDWTWNLGSCGYCFIGKVADVRYECIYRKLGGAASLAVVEFEVKDLFWGPKAKTFVIETKVQRKDCPIIYDTPKFSEINLGAEFLVVGRPKNLNNKLPFYSLFLFAGNELVDEAGVSYNWKEIQEMVLSEAGNGK